MSGDTNFGKVIAFVAFIGFALYSFFAIGFGLSDDSNVSGLHTQAQVLLVVWIVLLVYFVYRARGWKGSLFQSSPTLYPTAPRTNLRKYWRCPNCRAILEKTEAGMLIGSSDVVMVGTVTCGNCRTPFSARDVYGGRYDI
jgi:hypothetical protein